MKSRILIATVLLFVSELCGAALTPLDRWVVGEAAPDITAFIEASPRFGGQAVAVMAMRDGDVMEPSNRLEKSIARQLRDHLVQHASVRIPVSPGKGCSLDSPDLVLAVEIVSESSQHHRVTLALVDQRENIWINGSPVSWTGRLSSQERNDLQVYYDESISEDQTGAIARAIVDGVGCAEEFARPVYLESELVALRQVIEDELRERTIFTHNPAVAGTHLRLTKDVGHIRLVMVGDEDPVLISQVALAASSRVFRGADDHAYQPLLANFELDSKKQFCDRRAEGCVDVAYEVDDRAYVIEFLTLKGKVFTRRCNEKLHSQRGRKGFGLNVPASPNAGIPSLGYYVLATSSRQVAEDLRQLLTGSSCNSRGGIPDLPAVTQLVAEQGVEWKAMHLVNYRGRVSRIKGDGL